MAEQFHRVGAVELCYESLGDPADPAVLLVMGLGLQMVWWRDEFCAELVDRGFRVIRFDNRDVGRSTKLPGPGVTAMQFLRRRPNPSYSLGEMADDAAGLVAELAPAGAHLVGVSLGSFIAQEIAIRQPGRALSLTSIMGRPGDGRSGRVARRMLLEFLRPAPVDANRAVEHMVATFRRIGSLDRTEIDDEDVRLAVRRSAARGTDVGSDRQLAAILAERDRTAALGSLEIPALVIHGMRDRIVLPSGGRATAAAIPGAELLEIERMGHDLPRWVWPQVIDGIERTARRA
ncbi:MAG: alpha/beta hydrolase [Thermoleophilaceae bacterium]|nr:alpha/beta hydrolase [Thermoleophilaceae bacterium]